MVNLEAGFSTAVVQTNIAFATLVLGVYVAHNAYALRSGGGRLADTISTNFNGEMRNLASLRM